MASLSNRTFGVEFEVTFLEKKWKEFLKSLDVKQTSNHIADANTALTKLGLTGWEAKEDGSIKGGDYPVEFVSPILQGSNGLKQVLKFSSYLRNFAEVNESTGLHVHVGAQDFKNPNSSAEKLTAALLQYKNVEEIFDSLVLAHRQKSNSTFARSPMAAQSIVNRYKTIAKGEKSSLIGLVQKLQDDRYMKLNIHSLIQHGTLEFRQLHGTLNPELVKNWIILCTKFVDTVAETEQMFVNMLRDLKSAPMEGNEEKLSPRGEQEAITFLIEKLSAIIYDEAASKSSTDSYYKSLLNKGEFTVPGMVQMLLSSKINTQIVNNPQDKKDYLYFLIPNSLWSKIFRPQNAQAGVKRTLEGIKSDQGLDKLFKNTKFQPSAEGLHVLIPETDALQMAEDRIGIGSRKESPLKPEYQATLDKAKQALIGGLPQRNISKIGKQTATSPLYEELQELLKLIDG